MTQKKNIGLISFTLTLTLIIKQLNPPFLETLNYFKTIPKLVVVVVVVEIGSNFLQPPLISFKSDHLINKY